MEIPQVNVGMCVSLQSRLTLCDPMDCSPPGSSSLGGEDTLEKEMATHSSILAWEISWTEEPGRSMKSQESDTIQ